MKNNLQKISIIFAVSCVTALSFTFAQTNNVSVSSSDLPPSQVEISFPIQKDDFLLFYGTTKDTDTNAKINELRKEFVTKFEALKSEYKKSFAEIIAEQELTPLSATEGIAEIKVATTAKIKSTVKTPVAVTKKYSIDNEDSKTLITPVVNIIDNQSTIHTENSSWFKKVKSFFGW